jgi:hypothetical protein
MNYKILVFWGLLVTAGIVNAQSNFIPGYIITAEKDTLYGHIDFRSNKAMNTRCRFKAADNTITDYSPSDILAFRLLDSKYYISKKVGLDDFFLEYLINGKVDIFFMYDNLTFRYFIEKDDVMLTEIPYEEGIRLEDGKKLKYKSTTHIGYLFYYMQDAPHLHSKIKSIRKPNKSNLVNLALDYHNSAGEGEPVIIYERLLPLFNLSVEPFAGITKMVFFDMLTIRSGVNFYLSSPRFNDQISFKTGVHFPLFANEEYEGSSLTIYHIPAQLQYNFRTPGKLKPHVSGGWNFWKFKTDDRSEIAHTFSLNAGIKYQLSEKLHFNTNIQSDFVPFTSVFFNRGVIIDLVSYSLNFGLVIDL